MNFRHSLAVAKSDAVSLNGLRPTINESPFQTDTLNR